MAAFAEPFMSFALSLDQYVIRIVVAILILLVGLAIGRMTGKIIRTAFRQAHAHDIIPDPATRFSIDDIIGSSVSYAIYIASVIIALSELSFSTQTLLILVAIVLCCFLVMMISFRRFTLNLLSGIAIYFRERLLEGMIIKVGKRKGHIQNIGLLETILIDKKGRQMSIPNAELFTEPVIIERHDKRD